MHEQFCSVNEKENVTKLLIITDRTVINSAVLSRFENVDSGFHANERP